MPDARKSTTDELDLSAAEQAYLTGTHPTALEDWLTFRQHLDYRSCRYAEGRGPALATGFLGVDNATGGLPGITLLGGPEGSGKTTLGLNLAVSAIRHTSGVAVLFYSLDLPKERLYLKLLAQECGIDAARLQGGALAGDDWDDVNQAEETLRSEILPYLRVVERSLPRSEVDHRRIIGDCKALMKVTECETIFVVIDHLRKVEPEVIVLPDGLQTRPATDSEADRHRLETLQLVRERSISAMSPAGFPILVISELRKDIRSKTPKTDDILGPAALKFEADNVLLLSGPQSTGTSTDGSVIRELAVAKARDGVAGTTIPLQFDYVCARFHEDSTNRNANASKKSTSKKSKAKANGKLSDPLAGS